MRVRHYTVSVPLVLSAPLLTLAFVFAFATPVEAATTVSNGKIVYTEVEGSIEGSDIYTVNPDGSDTQNLISTGGALGIDNEYPQWSPDGTKIAYNANPYGEQNIYVMNADGSDQTPLTNDPATDVAPDWSPDGTKIAFASNRDGDFEIFTTNMDGSQQIQLTTNNEADAFPLYSPDGTKILFQRANSEIWIMSADGTNQQATGLDGLATDWSPDGSKFLAILQGEGAGQLYTVDAATFLPIIQLTPGGTPFWASYSPDGTKIVYTYSEVAPEEQLVEEGPGAQDTLLFQVYVMNADGSGKTLLTDNTLDHFFVSWQPVITVTPDPDSLTPAVASVASTGKQIARADELPKAGLGGVLPLTLSVAIAVGALSGRRRR